MLTLTKADKFNHRPKTFDVRLGKQSHKRTIPAYHSFSLKAQFLSLKAHPLLEVLVKL